MQELQIDSKVLLEFTKPTKHQLKTSIRMKLLNQNINTIKEKKVHGQQFETIDVPHINENSSLAWLQCSTFKRSTDSIISLIQENAISTKYIKKHIHKRHKMIPV